MTQGFNSSQFNPPDRRASDCALAKLDHAPSRDGVRPQPWQALLAFTALFLGSCNLPPCLEGRFRVELGERIPDSNCPFADRLGGTSFTFETVGYLEDSYDCGVEKANYLDLPQGSERVDRGGGTGGGVPKENLGWDAVRFESLAFDELEGCTWRSIASLWFKGSYKSLPEAVGKKDGFFVNFNYNAFGGCPDLRSACFNAHPATVTRL